MPATSAILRPLCRFTRHCLSRHSLLSSHLTDRSFRSFLLSVQHARHVSSTLVPPLPPSHVGAPLINCRGSLATGFHVGGSQSPRRSVRTDAMIIGTPAPPRSLISLSCHLRFLVPRSPSPCPLSLSPPAPSPRLGTSSRPHELSSRCHTGESQRANPAPSIDSNPLPSRVSAPGHVYLDLLSGDPYTRQQHQASCPTCHKHVINSNEHRRPPLLARPGKWNVPLHSLTLPRPLFLSRGLYNYSISVINLFIHLLCTYMKYIIPLPFT